MIKVKYGDELYFNTLDAYKDQDTSRLRNKFLIFFHWMMIIS